MDYIDLLGFNLLDLIGGVLTVCIPRVNRDETLHLLLHRIAGPAYLEVVNVNIIRGECCHLSAFHF